MQFNENCKLRFLRVQLTKFLLNSLYISSSEISLSSVKTEPVYIRVDRFLTQMVIFPRKNIGWQPNNLFYLTKDYSLGYALVKFLERIFACENMFFLLLGQKIPSYDPPAGKKSCAKREKHLFYYFDFYPGFTRASNITLAK